MVITIDGPAAAGKSTVARLVAEKLGLVYLDTGAMYRAFTLKAIRGGADWNDEEKLVGIFRNTKIEFRRDPAGNYRIYLDGEDVSGEIRKREVTGLVSRIAPLPKIREQMVACQRNFARRVKTGVVVEGRDIGTVVFPDAERKFFLDAAPEERARRRFLELREKKEEAPLETVLAEMRARDESDRKRKVAPLRRAPDAVRVDTTGMSIDRVVEEIVRRV